MKLKTAIIAGATGLVGKELLQNLLDNKNYEKVISIVRRKTSLNHPKLEQKIIDFDNLDEIASELEADDFFLLPWYNHEKGWF